MQIYSSSFHRRHRLLAAIPQLQETLFHASRPTGAMADIQTPQADVGNSALPRCGQGGVQASNHSTEALVSAGNQDGLTHLNITYPHSLSPRAEAVVEQILQDNFGERKVIRHGCKVTKINNTPEGPMRISNEAATLHYRREHTTIPVPTVYEATSNSVTMDFIEGSNLEEAWNDLSDTEITAIAEQLGDYLVQLRNLRRSVSVLLTAVQFLTLGFSSTKVARFRLCLNMSISSCPTLLGTGRGRRLCTISCVARCGPTTM